MAIDPRSLQPADVDTLSGDELLLAAKHWTGNDPMRVHLGRDSIDEYANEMFDEGMPLHLASISVKSCPDGFVMDFDVDNHAADSVVEADDLPTAIIRAALNVAMRQKRA